MVKVFLFLNDPRHWVMFDLKRPANKTCGSNRILFLLLTPLEVRIALLKENDEKYNKVKVSLLDDENKELNFARCFYHFNYYSLKNY